MTNRRKTPKRGITKSELPNWEENDREKQKNQLTLEWRKATRR
jgi:hypothetical protein